MSATHAPRGAAEPSERASVREALLLIAKALDTFHDEPRRDELRRAYHRVAAVAYDSRASEPAREEARAETLVEAKARMYDSVLEALKSEQNRALPFGKVLADLGLDAPPLDAPVTLWIRSSGGPRALSRRDPAREEGR